MARGAGHAFHAVLEDAVPFLGDLPDSLPSSDTSVASAAGGSEWSNRLFIFVTESDLLVQAGSAIRSKEEAGLCFRQWYDSVPAWRRGGVARCPSVAVLVDGVSRP